MPHATPQLMVVRRGVNAGRTCSLLPCGPADVHVLEHAKRLEDRPDKRFGPMQGAVFMTFARRQ
jgi:hypothetical protein